MLKERLVSDFYKDEAINFGSYDNLRKIPSYIDGFKIANRKAIYTGFSKCYNNFVKTEPFANEVASFTQYLHGPQNLIGSISNMTASYITSNNYPLFEGNDSGFGSRVNPEYASGRYTRVRLANITKSLFNDNDNKILNIQIFEGEKIEPKYMVPIFPVILLNSSNGMSTGFASTIYARNPTEVIEYIKKRLAGTEHPRMDLFPWFKGHLGKVAYNKELCRNESFGVIIKNNMTSYTITELPIGVEYQKYVEFLDKLCENTTIQDYEDKCDPKTDKILFNIKTTREFTKKYEDRKLYETFHLVKSLPETLCCIDENNRVREFKTVQEILDAFIDIRLRYYQMRKDYILKTLKSSLELLVSKYVFIKAVVDKKIIVSNRKKDDIIKQIEKLDKVVKVDGSYEYLLKMPIYQLTAEKLEELKKQIQDTKDQYSKTKDTSIQTMWTDDLHELKKVI